MIKLTKFENRIITFSIIIGLFILNLNLSYLYQDYFYLLFFNSIIYIVLGLLFIMFKIVLSEDLSEITNLKYRIIDLSPKFQYSKLYKVQVLKICWVIVPIPIWRPVNKTSNSIEFQNIFGAKFRHYYSYEKEYKTREEALESIKKHKKEVIEKREKFFERPKRNKKNITYIK